MKKVPVTVSLRLQWRVIKALINLRDRYRDRAEIERIVDGLNRELDKHHGFRVVVTDNIEHRLPKRRTA